MAAATRGRFTAPETFGSPPPLGEGARAMGAGGSPRQCAINLKRGLPTAPILGGAEGGFAGGYSPQGTCERSEQGRFSCCLSVLSDIICFQHASPLRAQRAGETCERSEQVFFFCKFPRFPKIALVSFLCYITSFEWFLSFARRYYCIA